MKENKHRNVVNYLDSYLVGESELWVSTHCDTSTEASCELLSLLFVGRNGVSCRWVTN